MKYPLNYALVTNDYPIGISNEFIGEEGTVEVKNGMLLAILSPKPYIDKFIKKITVQPFG